MQGQSSIQEYYDREWAKLQALYEEGQPKPYDEGSLKSCAWLSALLHRRIDQAPVMVHAQLLDELYPYLIQDIPAYSMATYERQGAGSAHVHRGDVLKTDSLGAGQEVLHFETTAPLEVIDLSLTACRMISPYELELSINIPLSMAGKSLPALSLYWDAVFEKACMSYYMLNNQLRAAYALQEHDQISLSCEPSPMTYLYTLSDKTGEDYEAHRYLVDYFIYPQKYLMVSLYPREGLMWMLKPGLMTLHFKFNSEWPAQEVPTIDNIKFNAVPICNRYDQYCEPIRCDQQQVPYSITIDHADPTGVQIVRLKAVQGRVHQTGEIIHYRPACGYDLFEVPYYISDRKTLTCYAGPSVSQTLSLLASVCQKNMPHDNVDVGVINTRAGSNMSVRVLHRPTRLINRSSRGSADILYNHMVMATEDLISLTSFITMLKLLSRSLDPNDERRIEGLNSMLINTQWIMCRGSIVQERLITMTFNENHYRGKHDAYLFGTVLHVFFTYVFAVHERVSMVVTLMPSMEVFKWKPLHRLNIVKSS